MGSVARASRLSDHELRFAERIEAVLRAENVLYERSDVDGASPVEAHVLFQLRTSPGLDLRATLIVHGDVFVINVNEASVRAQSASYPSGMEEAWLEDAAVMLEALLTTDLRMRTRRGLLGRRTGAIYFGATSGKGHWSGELFASWWGKELRYSNWLKRRAAHEN